MNTSQPPLTFDFAIFSTFFQSSSRESELLNQSASWILGKETKRRQQRSPPSLAHVAIEKPSLETASAFYSSMAIIMDDIDDEDGPGVNSLSTDELRKEVARLQSMLGENEPEDGEEEEEEGEAAKGTVGHPADFDNPSFLNDVKLNYTNGDVYKVRFTSCGSDTPAPAAEPRSSCE